ncbi:MAG: acetate--CoA ligase family protein [Nitrososphaerales archaeon]
MTQQGSIKPKESTIIDRSVAVGRNFLLEHEAEKLASKYNIPVVKSRLAASEREAVEASRRLGYPVVMKVVSPNVLHKTDVGGVKVNIKTQAEAREAYRTIRKNTLRSNKDANVVGILVQKMAPAGHEFVVGATRDPQFGPTVMFGLGGIYVEIFKDVSFRFAPVSEEDSLRMIEELKSSALLSGYRGSKPLDISSASRVIRGVGDMIMNNEAVESIDINPLFVYQKGVMAADVRVMLKPAK